MTRLALLLALLATPAIAAERLLAFTREGCPPCAAWKADYERHPDMAGGRAVTTLQDDRDEERRWRVRGYPTFIVVDEGREVRRQVGYQGVDEFRAWVR